MGLSIEGNMHDHKVSDIHDQLHARCVVLDDGEQRLAIVIADSCMIPRPVFDEAKTLVNSRSRLPMENMLMAATHTHSAPSAVGIFQSTADPEYRKFLARRLADAVLQAINQLEPAEVGWGSGTEPRHVSNRRWKMKPGTVNKNLSTGANDAVRMNPAPANPDLLEPAGPTDPEVSVLAVRAKGGRPIALLANYSMHYCGGVGHDGVVSADYFGAFCGRVQQLLGVESQQPPFVALLSNGTSGDCNSIDFRNPAKPDAPFRKIQRVANDVADVALGVYKAMEFHDWVPLKSAQGEIKLGVRLPENAEVERAKGQLAKAERRNGQLIPWSSDIYAREAVLLSEYPREVPLILQVLQIGDLGIAAVPCEVFVEIGLELKRRSPFPRMFTIELANGYNGYLPTPAQHALGGYETWRARSSYLETEASPKIVAALLDLFAGVKGKAPVK
jgi:neutral ceramidase